LGLAAPAWFSTARWARQRRFAGKLFSARNGKPTFKNIVEPVAQNDSWKRREHPSSVREFNSGPDNRKNELDERFERRSYL
jgi:hypothetical protein